MSTIDGTEVSMSQNDSLRLAQEFLGRMGSGTETGRDRQVVQRERGVGNSG